MTDFIINGLMAHFFTVHGSSTSISSSDFDVDKYLSAKREYKHLCLTPIIIDAQNSGHHVANPEFVRKIRPSLDLYDGKMVGVRYNQSRYHLKIISGSFPKQHIFDGLNAAISLVTCSFVDCLSLVSLSEKEIPGDRKVPYTKFREWIAREYGIPLVSVSSECLSSSSFGAVKDHETFELLDGLLGNEQLLYALLFFREGLKDSTEIVFEEREILDSRESKPLTLTESVKMENCIHNFYKSIEAIYGGNLPQDQTKIIKRFKKRGVDLEAKLGFEREGLAKEKAIKKLFKLRDTRNFKSAHGRIAGDRRSSYYEVLDFQYLCRHLLYSVIREWIHIDLYHLSMPQVSFDMSKQNEST